MLPVIIAENGHVDQIVNLLEPLGYKIVDRTSYDTIWSKEWNIKRLLSGVQS